MMDPDQVASCAACLKAYQSAPAGAIHLMRSTVIGNVAHMVAGKSRTNRNTGKSSWSKSSTVCGLPAPKAKDTATKEGKA